MCNCGSTSYYYPYSSQCGTCMDANLVCYSGPNLPNTGINNGDTLKAILQKIDQNINGSIVDLTVNYIPVVTSGPALTNSILYQISSNVGIGTTSPTNKLDVNGGIRVRTLPTSSVGLNSGDFWRDGSNFVRVVP